MDTLCSARDATNHHNQSSCRHHPRTCVAILMCTMYWWYLTSLGLVQFCQRGWVVQQRVGDSSQREAWQVQALKAVSSLGMFKLTALVTSQLGLDDGKPNKEEAFCVETGAACQQYAVAHFHGRLLPGCCNLGCKNLGGISEAALGTQLCSGCRILCCVACQREAWKEGGHSSVCKM